MSGQMVDMNAAALGRYEVDGSGDSDPGTDVLLLMLGATIAPKADADEVDCVGSATSSELPPASLGGAASSVVVFGIVSDCCCCCLAGELTGVGPMIINEVSINMPLPPPGESDDDDDDPVAPPGSLGFCWFTEVRCRRSLLSLR